MTPEQAKYTDWVYRCHRPLSERQRKAWIDFYRVHFAYLNGLSDEAIIRTEPHYGYLRGFGMEVPKDEIGRTPIVEPTQYGRFGQKYAGPLSVAASDIKKMLDICNAAGKMFYYWGIVGNQHFAVHETMVSSKDLPVGFQGVEWFDWPYARG